MDKLKIRDNEDYNFKGNELKFTIFLREQTK